MTRALVAAATRLRLAIKAHAGFVLFALAFVVIFLCGLVVYVAVVKRETLNSARMIAGIYARTFEDHLTQTLNSVEVTLRNADLNAESGAAASEKLRTLQRNAPFLRSLSVADSEGVVRLSSNPANHGVRLAATDFMPRTAEYSVLRVAPPWRGRDLADGVAIAGRNLAPPEALTFIPVTLKLRHAGRERVLIAALNPDYFLHFYADRLPPARGLVEVVRYDGAGLFATDAALRPGAKHAGSPLLTQLPQRESGVLERIDAHGERFVSSYRASPKYPVVMLIHVNETSVIAQFDKELRGGLVFAIPAAVVILMLSGTIYRARFRERLMQAETLALEHSRRAALANALPAAVIMLDERGAVILVNAAWRRFIESLPGVAIHNDGLGQPHALINAAIERHALGGRGALDDGVGEILGGRCERFEIEREFATRGPPVWLQTIVSPVRAAGLSGVLLMHVDITERAQLQRTDSINRALLEAQGEAMRLGQELVGMLTLTWHLRNDRIEWSDDPARILGPAPVHGAYPALIDMVFEADRAHWQGTTATPPRAFRLVRTDGQIRWLTRKTLMLQAGASGPERMLIALHDVTSQVATELALAEARKQELAIANEIQKTLLVGKIPERIRGASIAAYSAPSQVVDGDFYVFHRHSETCFDLLVGDVMGKGIHAALIGAAVKETFKQEIAALLSARTARATPPGPADIVNAMHHALTPHLLTLQTFVTLGLYRIDLAAARLHYVNAGHTPVLLVREDGERFVSLPEGNLPIGVLPAEIYTEHQVAIAPGDVLLAYSDGVTEARNAKHEDFGEARLRALLAAGMRARLTATMLVQALRWQVQDFVGDTNRADDQTAVVIALRPLRQYPRGGRSRRRAPEVFNIPWQLDQLGVLRARLAHYRAWLGDEATSALTLAAFEIATNIIRHAGPPDEGASFSCCIEADARAVSVELCYLGAAFSPQGSASPDFSGQTQGGFGLYIVEHSVDQVAWSAPLPGVCSVRLVKCVPQAD